MVRVIIKGGVWKNTEDEILKAAISKYGKNQWARISSLLVRKTPKQCKARWYEWLDPSIKKTEWSKEEDEKLLHLAKLMPTQWRTIAPIVGRTATQCLERYQRLLDDAEAKDNQESGLGLTGPGGPEAAPPVEDVRRLRPGEIDPNPETKPARPDPIDMDEDEKEMLSEARARLANTQGKKAKRKARERALEEARRLAMLQKRRELKAAGIIMRPKKPKKGMDYNADIPFEKQPTTGFYDTNEEQSRAFRAPVGQTIKQMDGSSIASRAEAERKKRQRERDAAQRKAGEQGLTAQREEQLRKLREAEQISKRRKLNLPEAQVGEKELDEIVKLGHVGETAREMVQDGSAASERLLSDYSALERAKHARTPKTAPEEDIVMREARNLRNQTMAQTPLLGEANAPLHDGTGASGAKPRSGVVQTPNPLLTPVHTAGRLDPGATPMSVRGAGPPAAVASATPRTEVGDGRTPLRTPLRDNLGLNAEDGMSVVSATPRDLKRAQRSVRDELQASLRSLPAPKNDFDIVMDEDESEAAKEQDAAGAEGGDATREEDAAERDARLARLAEERYRKELARRSQVVQLGLPRPIDVDATSLTSLLDALPLPAEDDVASKAQRLVDREMVRLMEHDSITYPLPSSRHAGGGKSSLPTLPDEALDAARALIHAELAGSLGFPGAKPEVLKRLTASSLDTDTERGAARAAHFEAALRAHRDSVVWSARLSAWVDRDEASAEEVLEGLRARLEAARSTMSANSSLAAREEKRLGKLLGGYEARSAALASKIREAATSLQEASFAHAAFARLSDGESGAVLERTARATAEVQTLERKEAQGQARYRELDQRRRELRERVEELEQEVAMREAEGINDEALEALEGREGAPQANGAAEAETSEA